MMNQQCQPCSGASVLTPMPLRNRPGLNQLKYRIGTHAAFVESMIARMTAAFRDNNPLRQLQTRDGDDPSIALMDAWSVVADIMTMYQERIANEGYLTTAQDRRSVERLAQLVGYRLKPGLSASTHLAFTVDPTTTGDITIPAGTPAKTVPGQNELPQTFETRFPITARAEWNEIRPKTTYFPKIEASNAGSIRQIRLNGTTTGISRGDLILIDFDQSAISVSAAKRKVQDIVIDKKTNTTTLQFFPGAVSYDRMEFGIRSVLAAYRSKFIGPSSKDFSFDTPGLLAPGARTMPDGTTRDSIAECLNQIDLLLISKRSEGLAAADKAIRDKIVVLTTWSGEAALHETAFGNLITELNDRHVRFSNSAAPFQSLEESFKKFKTETTQAELVNGLDAIVVAADATAVTAAVAAFDISSATGSLKDNEIAKKIDGALKLQGDDLQKLAATAKLLLTSIGTSIDAIPADDPVFNGVVQLVMLEQKMADAAFWQGITQPTVKPSLRSPFDVTASNVTDGSAASKKLAEIPGFIWKTAFGEFRDKAPVLQATQAKLLAAVRLQITLQTEDEKAFAAAIAVLSATSPSDAEDVLMNDAFNRYVIKTTQGWRPRDPGKLLAIERAVAESLVKLQDMPNKSEVKRSANFLGEQLTELRATLTRQADVLKAATPDKASEMCSSVSKQVTDFASGVPNAPLNGMRSVFVGAIAKLAFEIANLLPDAAIATDVDAAGAAAIASQVINFPVDFLVGKNLKDPLGSLDKFPLPVEPPPASSLKRTGKVCLDQIDEYVKKTEAASELAEKYIKVLPNVFADLTKTVVPGIEKTTKDVADSVRSELRAIQLRSSTIPQTDAEKPFFEAVKTLGTSTDFPEKLREALKSLLEGKFGTTEISLANVGSVLGADASAFLRQVLPDLVVQYESLGPVRTGAVLSPQAFSNRLLLSQSEGISAAFRALMSALQPLATVRQDGNNTRSSSDSGIKLLGALTGQQLADVLDIWSDATAVPLGYRIVSLKDRIGLYGNAARDITQLVNGESKSICTIGSIDNNIDPINGISLEREYREITAGDLVVIENVFVDSTAEQSTNDIQTTLNQFHVRRVASVNTTSRHNYCTSGKSTRVSLLNAWRSDLDTDKDFDKFVRSTTVWAGMIVHEVVPEEIPGEIGLQISVGTQNSIAEFQIGSNQLETSGLVGDLAPGRLLILEGKSLTSGLLQREKIQIEHVDHLWRDYPGEKPLTRISLTKPLSAAYRRDTVKIYGNVAEATHGETHREIVGSGTATRAMQRFRLPRPDVSHLPTETQAAGKPELTVRVNDVVWDPADNILQLEKAERYIPTVYKAQTQIQFGDGRFGQRLPTGIENVRAVYRTGIGRSGNAKKDQISQMPAPVLGVQGVTNPLPGTGGVDPESIFLARRSTSRYATSLRVLVSLQDMEDFAFSFGGIAKATAIQNNSRGIIVYVAGADDAPLDSDSLSIRSLSKALREKTQTTQNIDVRPRMFRALGLTAQLSIDRRQNSETVLRSVRDRLLQRFSFERSDFGRDVPLSAVFSVLQKTPGVMFARVTRYGSVGQDKVQPLTAPDTQDSSTEDNSLSDIAVPEEVQRVVNVKPEELTWFTPDVPETIRLEEART